MKILFVCRHSGYLRLYDAFFEESLASGHEIVVGYTDAPKEEKRIGRDFLSRLEKSNVKFLDLSGLNLEAWRPLSGLIRSMLDLNHYLNIEYQNSKMLRDRAESFAPSWWVTLSRGSWGFNRILGPILTLMEEVIPAPRATVRALKRVRPDVVVVSMIVDFGSSQRDFVVAARELKIPSCCLVASWDNLSNKGRIITKPDRVVVWNDWQRQELLLLHNYPESRIGQTGAGAFDFLFKMQPTLTREEFLANADLPNDCQYLVYLGSSNFIAPFDDEVTYVQAFVNKLRSSEDERVRNMWVIIRPHPTNIKPWNEIKSSITMDKVLIFPKEVIESYDERVQEYFDTLIYSEATLGINTSAMIEAAILGKPVMTIVSLPSQRETVHFRYLRDSRFLFVGGLNEDIAEFLSEILDGRHDIAERNRFFVESFVRPLGIDESASRHQVMEVERAAGLTVPGRSRGMVSRNILRAMLLPLRPVARYQQNKMIERRLELKNRPAWNKITDRFSKLGGRILLGMTAYNGERFVKEAIESILRQTHRDFLLVCLDDGSTDETSAILQGYAKRDERVVYHRDPNRLGMVGAWKSVLDVGLRLQPQTEYFAWVSDHDVWMADWLKTMVEALDLDKGVVLAYPAARSIDVNSKILRKPKRVIRFDSVNKWDDDRRFTYVCDNIIGAGNMVYGLMRVEPLLACGVFRRVLLPDRLLMLELAMHGRFWQSDSVLWLRRRISESSIARQRKTLFGPRGAPAYSYLPWWLVFAATVFFNYGVRNLGPEGVGRWRGVGRAWRVLRSQFSLEVGKARNRWLVRSNYVRKLRAAAAQAWHDRGVVRRIRRDYRNSAPPSMSTEPTKVLFAARQTTHFPYFRTVLEALASRRASVDLLFDWEWTSKESIGCRSKVVDWERSQPRVRRGWSKRRQGIIREILFPLRELRSYVVYLARTNQSEYYAYRWFKLLTADTQKAIQEGYLGLVARLGIIGPLVRAAEYLTPPDPEVLRDIANRRPDVVLASPVVQRFSEEVEYIKAAKFLGIPTSILTLSWDTLSTKGLVHVMPDQLLVWNEIHRRQAETIHHVPNALTRVVGAPFLDRWFGSHDIEMDRATFFRVAKLDPNKEYIVYLGSSKNIARDESWFVEKLAEHFSTHADPQIRNIQLLVRPHPANIDVYQKLRTRENVHLWHSDGMVPDTPDAHAKLVASFRHARLVIGINTSAMIEAVLAGAVCATIALREYEATQTAAEHFQLMVSLGAILVVEDIEDIHALIARLHAGEDPIGEQRDAFVRDMARPAGIDRDAGDLAAELVLDLGLSTKIIWSAAKAADRPVPNVNSETAEARMLETRTGNQIISRRRGLEDSLPYQSYLRARQEILTMIDDEAMEFPGLSEYWKEELAGFDYMFDASPILIDRLREHCYHITGIKSYDYRQHHEHKARPYLDKFEALRKLDPMDLFVPESPALGGFGYVAPGGHLINIDTLKFYEVLIAMGREQLLQEFRATNGRRKRVMEIGSGWGGYAYSLKTLFPGLTYVLLDLPQTMIFSSTYLLSQFPTAKFVFIADQQALSKLDDCDDADFIFISYHLFNALPDLKLDLAINMVSFQEMPAETVRNYVSGLASMGCPKLYSLNRDKSPHNDEMTCVSDILAEKYSLKNIEVLPQQYTQFGPPPKVKKERGIHDYRHNLATLSL